VCAAALQPAQVVQLVEAARVQGAGDDLDRSGRFEAVQAAGLGGGGSALLSLPEEWHYGEQLFFVKKNTQKVTYLDMKSTYT
jgi:hypothetical protein